MAWTMRSQLPAHSANRSQCKHSCQQPAAGWGQLSNRAPCRSRQSRVIITRYSLRDRWVIARKAKEDLLRQEDQGLQEAGMDELQERLAALGEETLGITQPDQLRKLLAIRYHEAKCKAIRFPIRHTPSRPYTTKSYMVVPIDVQDVGYVDFMLDTGTGGTLITAELRSELGLSPGEGNPVKGLASGGLTLKQKIKLPELRLGSQLLDIAEGCVTSLNRADWDHGIGGVLGVRFLSSYDIEMVPPSAHEDAFSSGSLAFHPMGHVEQGVLPVMGLDRVSCRQLKGGLQAVNVSLNGSAEMLGIIDLGATVSTINWAAAQAAGLADDPMIMCDGSGGCGPARSPSAYAQAPHSLGTRALQPGEVVIRLGDADLGESHVPREQPALRVREVPILSTLGYNDAPACVLGRDIIGRTRTVLSLGKGSLWLQS